MLYDFHFGPAAQTPAARAWVLQHMQALLPNLRATTPAAQWFCTRYVAGELSWEQLRAALDAESR
ncbi:hypothetical protein [Hymenobacter coccineus]|uniref:Antitoxin VbhA domain-containing protein n=1 Tax=Hymenobacter coccineus TaxID=1908235 RepID=A0A1G1TJG4_9BACT|nr:hypothetical protein [Hymenobacter coccineus]OGX91009.1 hypothetical protein BEN49_21450 [Hymenobacter coccineus]